MEGMVKSEIRRMIQLLAAIQERDGAWRFCFESGPMTDAYMILLSRTLQVNNAELVERLARRLVSLQGENGAWRLFPDEPHEGNLSATVEAYMGILASRFLPQKDERMQAARQYILTRGGISNVSLSTKTVLSFLGQLPWRNYALPAEFVLLHAKAPLSFFDFVGYARVHIAPVLLGAGKFAPIPQNLLPGLSDLLLYSIKRPTWQTRCGYLPAKMKQASYRRLERFMFERIEPDGTLYSYASATIFMVFALYACGYSRNHPILTKAVEGLKSLVYPLGLSAHLQNSTSTVWDTALLSYALQAAGVSTRSQTIQLSSRYLLSHQHHIRGDWGVRNPSTLPAGWGFSDVNSRNPDVDDTAVALRALTQASTASSSAQSAWNRGLGWLISMQNRDGGWPAFERNTNKRVLSSIQIDGTPGMLTDPSTSDLTGRTLEFLGNYAKQTLAHAQVRRAAQWLIRQQERDGSWKGRWGISYIYGTWAAITGLCAVGVPTTHPAIRRAVQWLLHIQNPDGGWGESCLSELRPSYVQLSQSTLSQTAWAVDALVCVFDDPIPGLQTGVRFLLDHGDSVGHHASYPTGSGLPGGFHIHYHSYRYIWPLLALGHYQHKYGQETWEEEVAP